MGEFASWREGFKASSKRGIFARIAAPNFKNDQNGQRSTIL